MNPVVRLGNGAQDILESLRVGDFLAPLLLRLYLAPVFWVAGMNKLLSFDSTANWLGNPDWGLGLPYPEVLTVLVILAELGGSVLLLFGLAVRWIAIPLLITMVVAATTVHWDNGWQAVADPMSPFASETLGPLAFEAGSAAAAGERTEAAESLLREHGNYNWLTEQGSFVVSNNGIEWATTYFVMILALFFLGAGRFVSLDYWLARRFRA
jgi:uncharacterized membrane protein YphA (DoxX/SURF4 family)